MRKPSLLREALVVKLGGSLSETGELKRWLALIARASRPVIVVPGGGAFADAVRRAQAETRFSDAAAHRMAILAMHQTGLMLIAMQPRLIGVETRAQMRAALHAGRIAVWLPLRMCDRDDSIPQDWSITSDGLAARLAETLKACAVCLIKSRCCDCTMSIDRLAREGIADPQFAAIVTRAGLIWRVIGPGEERKLAAALGIVGARATAVAKPAQPRRREAGRRGRRTMLSREPHGTN